VPRDHHTNHFVLHARLCYWSRLALSPMLSLRIVSYNISVTKTSNILSTSSSSSSPFYGVLSGNCCDHIFSPASSVSVSVITKETVVTRFPNSYKLTYSTLSNILREVPKYFRPTFQTMEPVALCHHYLTGGSIFAYSRYSVHVPDCTR